MEGYKDIENEIKAKQVKYLVTLIQEGNDDIILQSDNLSLDLADYLKQVGNFEKHLFQLPNLSTEEKRKIRDFTTDKQFLTCINSLFSLDKLKLHSIAVFYVQNTELDSNETMITCFVDENGFHFTNTGSIFLTMPGEFYDFLERMGLTIRAANILYGFDFQSIIDTEWREFLPFKVRDGYWPLVVRNKEKIY
jgi:hypothetical protein